MSQVRIIIKPKGLIILSTVAISLIGISLAGSRLAGKPEAKSTPSAPVGAAPASAAPAPAEEMSQDEREEKDLLVKLDQNGHQARPWLLIGPLPAGTEIESLSNNDNDQAKMDRIISTSYLPDEAKYQAQENAHVQVGGKAFTWRKIYGSAFDFKKLFTSYGPNPGVLKNVVAYGFTTIDSPGARTQTFRFRSDDGAIVWVNGKQVYRSTKIRGVRDEDTFKAPLHAGKNTILVKVGQGGGGWGMMLQTAEK